MCEQLNSGVVLGNIFIETVRAKKNAICFKEILEFESKFNDTLEEENDYYSYIRRDELLDFVQENADMFQMNNFSEDYEVIIKINDNLLERLNRFFRVFLDEDMITLFHTVYTECFE